MSENYKIDYDEISPIGGNKTVLVEHDEDLNDDFKLCMETGYQTYYKTWRTSNKDLIASLEKSMSDIVKKSKVLITTIDEQGIADKVIWYPYTSFNSNAILYPEFNSENALIWKISTLRRVKSEDELEGVSVYKYPAFVDGKPVLILLIPNEQVFESQNFEEVFDIFETEYKIAE